MKLYIWEGNGISSAYHDDGTLVVLAETVEEAREIVRRDKAYDRRRDEVAYRIQRQWCRRRGIALDGANVVPNFRDPRREEAMVHWQRVLRRIPPGWDIPGLPIGCDWDGTEEALDGEPDRVMELDTPVVVAFNGGGYD